MSAGVWGWVKDVGKTCGFAPQPQAPAMWVRAQPDLFPQQVPGMSDELLAGTSQDGGSLEAKLQAVVDAFRSHARHLESLQQVLRRRALERREQKGEAALPPEVEAVISEGLYLDSFLEAYDGQTFSLFSEEIVPCHAYRLALEVHSGGAYWSGVPTQDPNLVKHKVETVTASSPTEGTTTLVSHFGAAQRGAVFVWRWQHLLDEGPYKIPDWLCRCLAADGNDPLRKLMGELETIQRWQQQVKQETAKHVKEGQEVKDPYVREVLRLWPTESDPHGGEQLKKCAWVEGLDARLFVSKPTCICRVPYDGSHVLVLTCSISKRHSEDGPKDGSPPYRLVPTWTWQVPPERADAASRAEGDGRLGQDPLGLTTGSRVSLGSSFALTETALLHSHTSLSGTGGGLYRPGTGDSRIEAAAAPNVPSAVTHSGGCGGYTADPLSPAPCAPASPTT